MIKLTIPCRVNSTICYATLECPDTIIVGEGSPNVFKLYSDGAAAGQTVMALVQGNDGSLVGLFNVAVSTTPQTVSVSFADTNWTSAPNSNRIPFTVEGMSPSAGENVSATLYAYATQDMAPDFGLNVSPTEGIIQGKTELAASIANESTRLGASIVSRSISIGGSTSSGVSHSIVPWSGGSYEIIATITDSRGLSTTHSTAVNVTAYYPPGVDRITCERVDAEGNPDPEGTRVEVSVVWHRGGEAGGDTSCSLMYRAGGTTDFVDTGAVESGQVYLLDGEFGTDKQYEFAAIVRDSLSSISKTAILEMAFFTLDFLAGGRGVAVGQACTEEGFTVNMPTKIRQNLFGEGYGMFSEGMYRDQRDLDYLVNPSSDRFYTMLGMTDANDQLGPYIEGYYLNSGHIGMSLYLKNRNPDDRSEVFGGIQMALSRYGEVTYNVSNWSNFRQAIDAPGVAYDGSYHKLTAPNGNAEIWLKAPRYGFIPDKNSAGVDTSSIGSGRYWQFENIWGKNLYIDGSKIADHAVDAWGYSDDGNWSWIKYKSGFAIAVMKITASLSGRTDYGWNSYYTVNNSITYPFDFAYPPAISFSYDSGNAIGVSVNQGTVGTAGIGGGNIYIWAPYQKTNDSGRQLRILLAGRWFW